MCDNKIEQVICEPGDLVLFDCNIIHGSVMNMTPWDRTNLFVVFNSIENVLQKPFSALDSRPEEMGTRNIKEIF
jgi:ectoine hydroxylase